jgi:hypothetical protein
MRFDTLTLGECISGAEGKIEEKFQEKLKGRLKRS